MHLGPCAPEFRFELTRWSTACLATPLYETCPAILSATAVYFRELGEASSIHLCHCRIRSSKLRRKDAEGVEAQQKFKSLLLTSQNFKLTQRDFRTFCAMHTTQTEIARWPLGTASTRCGMEAMYECVSEVLCGFFRIHSYYDPRKLIRKLRSAVSQAEKERTRLSTVVPLPRS